MVHNTTCKVPYKVWCSECKDLRPYIPVTSSDLAKGHKVLNINKLRHKGSLYSLPFGTYRGEETRVLVHEVDGTLVIKTMDGELLAKLRERYPRYIRDQLTVIKCSRRSLY